MSVTAKRQIIQTLDELPEHSLATVAEFVDFLRAKAVAGPIESPTAPTKETRPYGLAAGDFITPDDFDAPLPAEILDGFEGR